MTQIDDTTINWLDTEINRHGKWRKRWSFLYFFFASATIIAGAATTAVAGLVSDETIDTTAWTTGLAGLTTILASLEKVLKFREKWDLHRNIQVTLEMIRLRASNGLIELGDLIDRIDNAAHMYSSQLSDLAIPAPQFVKDD